LEAALLHEQNTSDESAKNMIEFARGLDVHINLIPWNPVAGLPFEEPTTAECKKFVAKLERAGLNVTLRTRRGREIGGACGQLGKTLADSQGNGKRLSSEFDEQV
ncbi:MAG: 23S rRNA (adenine(2503)-C2)-methyltransferase, partial [Treponema sp.]|nr:23S rRNA (adenine(2503)-C2)-methyltransferase [Treponema sp.]